jgi:Holliday junction resolvase RusA-like endonuclease
MKLTVVGNVPSQKNGKEIAINRSTGQRFIRSNDRVKAWQESAIQQLMLQFMGYQITDYPIGITLVFFFDSERRHDLDNAAAGVMDALAKSGIITDDCVKYVDCLDLQYGGIDKINPRAEIYIDE